MPSAEEWSKALAQQIVAIMNEAKAAQAKAQALASQAADAQMSAKAARLKLDALKDEMARAGADAELAEARAEAYAKEQLQAEAEARAAEAKAIALGEQLSQAQAEAEAEAMAKAETVAVYQPGRYECRGCGQNVLFTEATTTLPVCDNCGGQEYRGQEPVMTKIMPTPGKQYRAGMYHCKSCGARVAVPADTNSLPACEFCGQAGLAPVS
ncbi:MAG: zinc ribbon-containing protein [Gammaproteobacteria bacterium]|nr:zinc ribbon-containing protein [Gammaproteobacteria bacterium]